MGLRRQGCPCTATLRLAACSAVPRHVWRQAQHPQPNPNQVLDATGGTLDALYNNGAFALMYATNHTGLRTPCYSQVCYPQV